MENTVDIGIFDNSHLVSQKTGKFRFNRNYVILTYRSHICKEDLRTFLERKLLQSFSWVSRDALKIIISHETGNSDNMHPYAHTHVYLGIDNDKNKIDTKNCRYFDYIVETLSGQDQIHAHIRPVNNTEKDKIRSQQYVCKEDPELKELYDEFQADWDEKFSAFSKKTTKKTASDPYDKIESADILDKLDSCITFLEVRERMKEYCFKPGPDDTTYFDPGMLNQFLSLWRDGLASMQCKNIFQYPPPCEIWSQELLEKIIGTDPCPYDRMVHVYYDLVGKIGKTWLAGYIEQNYPGTTLVLPTISMTVDNIMNLIKQALETTWTNPKYLFINLSRTCENKRGLYEFLENVLDGRICTGKYKGMNRMLPKIKVYLFCNFKPKVFLNGKPTLSLDRWDINEIVRNKDGVLETVHREVFDKQKFEVNDDNIEVVSMLRRLKRICPSQEYINDIWEHV